MASNSLRHPGYWAPIQTCARHLPPATPKSGNYTRLNALGADAYLVQSNFLRLQSGADALMRGNTGLLSMDPTLSIKRQLSPATFDAGVLKAQ